MTLSISSLRAIAEQAKAANESSCGCYIEESCETHQIFDNTFTATTVLALLDTIKRLRAALQEFIRLDEDCYLMVQTPNGNELVSALAAAQQALSQGEAGT